jgi:alpha-glucuronidase
MRRLALTALCSCLAALTCAAAHAQTADQAWLNYTLPTRVVAFTPIAVRALGNDPLEQSAVAEINRSLGSLAGRDAHSLTARARQGLSGQTVVGTVAEMRKAFPDIPIPTDLATEGYWIFGRGGGGDQQLTLIVGADPRGVLYGAFAFLRYPATAMELRFRDGQMRSGPRYPIRWVDQWDNADGSIERGYAGRSLFFEGGQVRDNLQPVAEYARLLASIGINAVNVNNVNNAAPFLEPQILQGLARAASAMRPWGVRLALSVDIASPQKIGGLATFDPLDPAVQAWWRVKVDAIYALIPDFAGFTVKADSEGQPGPASYGRTPADAANVLAAALAPHGGVVLYRAFVYNHHLDPRDPRADRARAAYDIFHPLDGKFAPNVIVQTKEGPIDFQAREPVSPLFAGLPQTRQAIELQITQEYTGQQRHLVYLAPMWKQVLDFDMRAESASTPVQKLLARQGGGMVGVSGVGRDRWRASPLALANLYAFGRLAWDPTLTPQQIAEEWTRQTLGADPEVVHTVTGMLMASWPTYESYTGPLGLQTLTDITGTHYGPNIESSENNGWGQWHRADHLGVGMDRTSATGTGFASQYPAQVAAMYESAAITPDDLLLFFHHVPYTYRLHSGKTVIQFLYDSHYDGAAQAAAFVRQWDTLAERIDPALFADVRARLVYQAAHAIVWRDAVVQYFFNLSGIPDEKDRAGHFPGRLEAEDARLTGYTVFAVTPWEDASRGKAVACSAKSCAAEWTYSGPVGRFDIAVQYFDLQGGAARFNFTVGGRPIGTWSADALLPSDRPHGDNSTRHTLSSVEIHTGDVLRVDAAPDGPDAAALDYIELTTATP